MQTVSNEISSPVLLETGIDISCKLSLMRRFARNVKSCFLENKKPIINLSSAELVKRVVKVKRLV